MTHTQRPEGVAKAGAFTPGPWSAKGMHVFGEVEGEQYIATAHILRRSGAPEQRGFADTQDETTANARLIAAAPDMFAALEAMLRAYGNEADEAAAHRLAEAALARARNDQ